MRSRKGTTASIAGPCRIPARGKKLRGMKSLLYHAFGGERSSQPQRARRHVSTRRRATILRRADVPVKTPAQVDTATRIAAQLVDELPI